ncbi:hypothetical protein PCCS19_18330 [Paenibacillus sp. CCS19]|uniref:outer membrane protein assembly factor BamB family protein n=1 Tax=Paenibacillus sp. CCS19 TaxID=3158387 RepID=UPI00256D7165|nr:PQQ-binding-like beta-propeller repeat protein [Paenibacillus cellulosilyticus]GMK38779.1 hypothetical protein PCCS19_18330 [Paenibacillus cellulosilyticus]
MKQKLNKVMPLWSKLFVGATATALLLFGALPESNTQFVLADQPVVSENWGTYELNAPFKTPQWSLPISNWNSSYNGIEPHAAIAEDGRVIAIDSKGHIVAIDAVTGKQLWANGNSWRPLLTYTQGTVYGTLSDGRIAAVSAAAGKVKWTTSMKVNGVQSIERIGDAIYVTAGMKLYAFNAATGALNWKTVETGAEYSAGFEGLQLVDGVIIRTYLVQGALSSTQINAYDAKSGKLLWKRFKAQEPIAVRGGLLYSVQDSYNMGDYDLTDDGQIRESLIMNAINARTGEVKGTRTYSWTRKFDPTQSTQYGVTGAPMLDGDKLYIFQGEKLALYDFSQYKPNAAPLQTWGQLMKDAYPMYAVHGERMLYRNYMTGTLAAMKLANGQVIGWQTDNPAVQTDIYGNGVYIGQSDGVFHAYDYATTKPLFSVKTNSRYFGPTLKTNGMIIVQSKGMLQAVKLPAALK